MKSATRSERNLPERNGSWKTICNRFNRRTKEGSFEKAS